ncbi:MAG: aminotransferase class V-fold PLP-dependent enzyme [Candidatus Latescibacteria bacterium]|nr:aminotransferase class V-fold PLP-dependent enzyme [Candidatus Latescibacterota bacterium]
MPASNSSLANRVPESTDPRVLDEMMPYLTELFGNAASLNHSFGWAAQDACDRARDQIAAAIGARSGREVVFTSSHLESDRLAVLGVATAYTDRGQHVLASGSECYLRHMREIAEDNEEIELGLIPLDQTGVPDFESFRKVARGNTVLYSLAIESDTEDLSAHLRTVGQLCRERGVLFHVSTADILIRRHISVEDAHIDLLTLDSRKLAGPPGISALYVRARKPMVRLAPLIDGGGQERGRRSGTLNVAGIVGLGAACHFCDEAHKLMEGSQ